MRAMRRNLSSDAMKTVRDNPIAGDIGGNSMRATTVSSLTFDAGFTLSGLLSGQNDRLERNLHVYWRHCEGNDGVGTSV